MSNTSGLIYFPANVVAQTFERGGVLFDGNQPIDCAVHASRREGPGEAELHENETDLMFVQEGQAVLVTGGRLHEARQVGAGEFRATRIDDGVAHVIAPGDVFLIPRGTPHWFREVTAPLLYLTVKIR